MEKKHQYQGLTKQEVEESRRLHGENILTPPEKASLWSQFLEKFNVNAVSRIKAKSVNIKLINPASYAFQKILNNLLIL